MAQLSLGSFQAMTSMWSHAQGRGEVNNCACSGLLAVLLRATISFLGGKQIFHLQMETKLTFSILSILGAIPPLTFSYNGTLFLIRIR